MSILGVQERELALAKRFRAERKARKLSIAEFAGRAGIKPRTYAHFEQTGEISLNRLIRALMVLGRADEIETLLRPRETFSSLDEMEKAITGATPSRKR
jgi:transcriptional regulator with XRE-family HTH domain